MEGTLNTNIWPQNSVGLLTHTFPNVLPTRRRTIMHSSTSQCLRSQCQCSCRFVITSLAHLTFSFRDNLPFSQELLWSPHPRGPPSPQNDTNSPSEPSCRQATPLADAARRKWYCSVCEEGFRNKHDCERHIDNVGKRARCKACKKTVCGRKDNRKRHYTKYCKSMDQREGLSLEEAFAEV